MPQMFGGGSNRTHFQEQSGRAPTDRTKMGFDLALRSLLSNVMKPQAMNIPAPMGEAISGMQNIMPSLFAGAFGPGRGLGSFGMPPPGGTGPGGVPAVGTPLTRDQLGMNPPTSDPAGFLPPLPLVGANLPSVRVPRSREIDKRLANRAADLSQRISTRSAAGLPTTGASRRLAGVERRQQRRANDPGALPGYGG